MQRYNLCPSRFIVPHRQYLARGSQRTETFTSSVLLKSSYSRSTLSSRIVSAEQLQRSLLGSRADGGGERDRTDDLLLAKQALSQLSYGPVLRRRRYQTRQILVGLAGVAPATSHLSGVRSN